MALTNEMKKRIIDSIENENNYYKQKRKRQRIKRIYQKYAKK